MKRESARARVHRAEIRLVSAERKLEKSSRPLRARLRLRQHRAAAIVLSGVASGLALSLLPIRWWGHVGALLAKVAAGAARSALAPVIVGAAMSQVKHSANAGSDSAEVSATE